jgi:hypothetical protein
MLFAEADENWKKNRIKFGLFTASLIAGIFFCSIFNGFILVDGSPKKDNLDGSGGTNSFLHIAAFAFSILVGFGYVAVFIEIYNNIKESGMLSSPQESKEETQVENEKEELVPDPEPELKDDEPPSYDEACHEV